MKAANSGVGHLCAFGLVRNLLLKRLERKGE